MQEGEIQKCKKDPLYALLRRPASKELTKKGEPFVDMVLEKCCELVIKVYGNELTKSTWFIQAQAYFKNPICGTPEKVFFVLNLLSMLPELHSAFPPSHSGFYQGMEAMLLQALNHEWSAIDIQRTIDDLIHAVKLLHCLPPIPRDY